MTGSQQAPEEAEPKPSFAARIFRRRRGGQDKGADEGAEAEAAPAAAPVPPPAQGGHDSDVDAEDEELYARRPLVRAAPTVCCARPV